MAESSLYPFSSAMRADACSAGLAFATPQTGSGTGISGTRPVAR